MFDNIYQVTHVYGLTETYGPAVICSWHPEWDSLPIEEQVDYYYYYYYYYHYYYYYYYFHCYFYYRHK